MNAVPEEEQAPTAPAGEPEPGTSAEEKPMAEKRSISKTKEGDHVIAEATAGNPQAAIPADRVPMDRDIEFSHVSFRYNENSPWVLRDLSMKIRAGTTVGILGATGSGKTTLVLLLDRLWELQEDCGKITIGGRDIRSIDRGWLR